MDCVNYWLIEMNAEAWDLSKCVLGDCQTLDSKNKAGSLKPLLGDMKVGELVIVYEAAPVSHIAKLLVVTSGREQVNADTYRDVVVKLIADIPEINLDTFKEKLPELHKRVASPAAIHKLSADEYHSVMKVAYGK